MINTTTTLPTLTIGHPLMARTAQLPAIGWEIILPPAVIAPAGLTNLTFTDQGIYLSDTAGRWDYIPYTELASLLQHGPDATVTLTPTMPNGNGNGRVTR